MMTGPHDETHKQPLICLIRRPSTAKRLQPIQLYGRILHISYKMFWCVVSLIIIQLLIAEYN